MITYLLIILLIAAISLLSIGMYKKRKAFVYGGIILVIAFAAGIYFLSNLFQDM